MKVKGGELGGRDWYVRLGSKVALVPSLSSRDSPFKVL